MRSAKSLAGILAKASLFGAKTVYGPSPSSVSTSPADLTTLTSSESSVVDCAVSTIVFKLESKQ